MKRNRNLLYLLLTFVIVSCKTPTNVAYFQDQETTISILEKADKTFRLRPEDKINIVVNSKDPASEALFTLTAPSTRNVLGASVTAKTIAGKNTSGGSSQQTIAYTVKEDGTIDFPFLGPIKAQGLTRIELAQYIKNQLITKDLVADPIVTVEYVNLDISVLGEVKNPGRLDITKDHYTILDAISAAGDLTIYGQRENVYVIRQYNGQQTKYSINLCSDASILNSPAYYLQQGDIVYVNPNAKRMRETTVSGNTVLTPSFWISVASLLTTITALIIR